MGLLQRRRTDIAALLVSSFAITFYGGLPAGGQVPVGGITPSAADLAKLDDAAFAALMRSLKSSYAPVTAAAVDRIGAELRGKMGTLKTYLAKGGANGQAWRNFLILPLLEGEIAKGQAAELGELRQVLERFRSGYQGLELPVFSNVAEALRRYIEALASLRDPRGAESFEIVIERLATTIEQGAPPPEQLDQFGSDLAWLEERGQQPSIVRASLERYSRPNFFVRASGRMLAAGMARHVNDTAPIVDCILGTSIHGSGLTQGDVSLVLVPDPHRASLLARFRGTTYSNTVGHNRSAVIRGTGQTQIEGERRIFLDSSGVSTLATRAKASTRTCITGIGSTRSGLAGRIVSRVASRKAPRQKAQAEQIASRHAEQKFAARYNEQTGIPLARGQKLFQDRFRGPFLRRGIFPRQMQFRTTQEELTATILEDARGLLAAQTPAPPIEGNPLLALRVHESFVNNVAAGILAGKTLDQAMVERLSAEFLGLDRDKLGQLELGKRGPWKMTFADLRPVTFKLADDGFTVILHGKRFSSPERRFGAMNVTAVYKLERYERGMKARRQGDVEVLPPDYDPAKGMFTRQRLDSVWLRRRIDDIFREEFVSEGLVLEGGFAALGEVSVSELSAREGWFSVAWDHAPQTASSSSGELVPEAVTAR